MKKTDKPNGHRKASPPSPEQLGLGNSRDREVESLKHQIKRLHIENEILLEGCALIREAAIGTRQVVGFSTVLAGSIFKVMRSPEEMKKEIDLRLADPRRTWWNDFGKEKFPLDANKQR